ncbi:MAG: tetratricopeptide repeat protein [Acidobacteria bacterium]|nr:tetratricopeptide repeat protein [Acidobacteriota bacterium]
MAIASLRLTAFLTLLSALLAAPAFAAEKPRLRVDDYKIDAELFPKDHRLAARAQVKFTALDDLSIAVFELHNALRPSRVLDTEGRELSAERVSQDSTIRVALPAGLARGASTTLTIEYEGVLQSAADSPVYGLNLAYVGEDTTFLLYPGRWFPVSGYLTNRFTASINITVPAGTRVIGSGKSSVAATVSPAPPARRPGRPAPPPPPPPSGPRQTYSFTWEKPSFPGTIIAGKFDETVVNAGGVDLRLYFKPEKAPFAQLYAETAEKEFQIFSSHYGAAPSSRLNLVQLPDETLPSVWAPEIAGIASRAIQEKSNYRLLANTIAHQWWGVSVSPATLDDTWITEGLARYSEARYVEFAAGEAGLEEITIELSVGALAYDTVPLSRSASLDPFSPEFQSLVTEKGGMVIHMLRFVTGEGAFDKVMRDFYSQFAGKSVTSDDFRKVAEAAHGERLLAFFSQWLDSTGAPDFRNKYTVFRVKDGFRVVGEISQDLDLFRMPVELRIDTDGPAEVRKVEVVGTASPYAVEVKTKPRRIQIDPSNRVLKSSPNLQVRVAILRGQQLVQQGALAEALAEYQKALNANKNSSLAHYRIAEVFFLQRNYQAAANSYRDSLNGDGEPKWTEVWSHVQLGKIFDLTGQRERAIREYQQAINTNDNTQGAQDEARQYLGTPYEGRSGN